MREQYLYAVQLEERTRAWDIRAEPERRDEDLVRVRVGAVTNKDGPHLKIAKKIIVQLRQKMLIGVFIAGTCRILYFRRSHFV